tara:strand:+ start:186 stop:716 length:531 start_codon:yes stop_codon:yes gene_type:complete
MVLLILINIMSTIQSQFMFIDASHIYKKYKKHKKGYIILGPPASGKTTFVKNQKIQNWTDTDDLFYDLNLNWHLNETNENDFKLNYLRADYLLEQSKLLGLRLIGSLYYNYIPDAIVILDEDLHSKYIDQRNKLYKTNILDKKFVFNVKTDLIEKSKQFNIPIFKSINDAIKHLEH